MKIKRLLILSFIFLVFVKINLFKRPSLMPASVWLHRGGIPENSLEGINNSLNNNIENIEVDVYFQEKNLILSHDKPFKNKVYPKLKDILYMGRLKNIWVDFKEYSVLKVMKSKANLNILKNKKIIVETKSILVLFFLRIKGIKTFYWYNPERYSFSPYGYNFFLLSFLKFIGQSTISIDSKYLKSNELFDFNINTFTINDKPNLISACRKKNINIILSDKIDFRCD